MIRIGVLCLIILVIAGAARLVGVLSFLILLGGIVSYLGDLLGSYFGKRKLSLLGLRPKRTGTLISLMTGLLITIATLGGAMLISEDYKDALLNYRALKSDQERLERVNKDLRRKEDDLTRLLRGVEASVTKISEELREAEEVRAELAEEIEQLRKDKDVKLQQIEQLVRTLKQKETGLIVITKNRQLSSHPYLLPFTASRDDVITCVAGMIDDIEKSVEGVGVEVERPSGSRVSSELVDPLWARFEEIRAFYQSLDPAGLRHPPPTECVIRPMSQHNLSYGEKLHGVYFDIQPNRVLFAKGEEIARTRLDGRQSAERLLQSLFHYDRQVQDRMLDRGVLPASLTHRLNQISADLLLHFTRIVARVRAGGGWVTVRMVATADIRAYGEISALYQVGEDRGGEAGRSEGSDPAPSSGPGPVPVSPEAAAGGATGGAGAGPGR